MINSHLHCSLLSHKFTTTTFIQRSHPHCHCQHRRLRCQHLALCDSRSWSTCRLQCMADQLCCRSIGQRCSPSYTHKRPIPKVLLVQAAGPSSLSGFAPPLPTNHGHEEKAQQVWAPKSGAKQQPGSWHAMCASSRHLWLVAVASFEQLSGKKADT